MYVLIEINNNWNINLSFFNDIYWDGLGFSYNIFTTWQRQKPFSKWTNYTTLVGQFSLFSQAITPTVRSYCVLSFRYRLFSFCPLKLRRNPKVWKCRFPISLFLLRTDFAIHRITFGCAWRVHHDSTQVGSHFLFLDHFVEISCTFVFLPS